MAADRVTSLARGGVWVASLPLRAADAVIDSGLVLEQRTRAALTARGRQLALDTLDALLTSDAIDLVLERIEAAGVAQRVAQRILEDGIAEQVVTLLLESEELWVLVDEIARSPSVTEAITHQSAGFVDQVTDTVRDRSREADAWVERAARRIGRRRPKAPSPLPGTTA
jgi:hypothetical protein